MIQQQQKIAAKNLSADYALFVKIIRKCDTQDLKLIDYWKFVEENYWLCLKYD